MNQLIKRLQPKSVTGVEILNLLRVQNISLPLQAPVARSLYFLGENLSKFFFVGEVSKKSYYFFFLLERRGRKKMLSIEKKKVTFF